MQYICSTKLMCNYPITATLTQTINRILFLTKQVGLHSCLPASCPLFTFNTKRTFVFATAALTALALASARSFRFFKSVSGTFGSVFLHK